MPGVSELEIASLMVECLNLEDVDPASIDPEASLFGEGLGLDSIDALELAVALSAKYGVHLKADDEQTIKVFSNLRSLTEFVSANADQGTG
jgi:acyl carrier protein